ncbi:MAG: hypothetical protein EXR79_00690 [Myxococcales bacterium]|nr:hypothetical protein [Myxococcales bacterium]
MAPDQQAGRRPQGPGSAALCALSAVFALSCHVGCRRAALEQVDASAPAATGPSGSLRAGWTRPPVVDFHGHLSLDGLDRLVQIMNENGIERIVNLSGGSYRRGPQAWAEAKFLSDQLGGRVLNFFNPDWTLIDDASWGQREAERLQVAVERFGFRGVKISKGLGLGVADAAGRLLSPDDARLHVLWRKAAELGIPVSIHVADPRAFWWPLDPRNERWDELKAHPYWTYHGRPEVPSWSALLQAAERLYRQNPRTIFVAVHFGNCGEDLAYVDGLLDRNQNVFIDISARLGEFGRHPAERVRAFFAKHQDRIVFGTDIGVGADGLMLGSNGETEPTLPDVKPFYDAHWRYLETGQRQIAHPSPIQGAWPVDAAEIAPEVLAKVYRGNATHLLDRAWVRQRQNAQPEAAPSPVDVPAPSAGNPPPEVPGTVTPTP